MTGALPFRLTFHEAEPSVEWVWWDGARYTEPFFEETLMRLRGTNRADRRSPRLQTPLSALRDAPAGLPLAGLIFHISRCGSTLVSQLLAGSRRNLVASEPPVVDEILRLRDRIPSITDDERVTLLRGTARALGPQSNDDGAERLFIKLDCWHIFSLELIQQAFPGVPLLFVYRQPLEVLVSLMRQPSLTLVRDTVTAEQLGLTTAERDALSREEHAAAIIGAFFRAAAAVRSSLRPLAYETLPGGLTTAFPTGFFSDEERHAFAATSDRHAKRPAESFRPDAEAKRNDASAALRSATARWADPAYTRWLATL